MITFLLPLPVGNAVRCILQPPAGVTSWRVLRKESATFSGHDDPAAVVVAEDVKAFVDAASVPNGVQLFYRPYYLVDSVWTAGTNMSVVPMITMETEGPDALELVRSRLEYGLKAELDAGVQGAVKHKDGAIPVLSAPPVFDETAFPIVTVHLASQRRYGSGIGELTAADVFDGDEWLDSEGVLWSIQLTIIGWVTNNPDTRILLRKAINRLLMGNLPVLYDAGLSEVEFSVSDMEDFQSYDAPMYQAVFTLNCIAPQAVSARSPAIADTTVTVTP